MVIYEKIIFINSLKGKKKEIQAKLKKSRPLKLKTDVKKSSLFHILSMLFLAIRYFLGGTLDVHLLFEGRMSIR